jgi:hypothetical protein
MCGARLPRPPTVYWKRPADAPECAPCREQLRRARVAAGIVMETVPVTDPEQVDPSTGRGPAACRSARCGGCPRSAETADPHPVRQAPVADRRARASSSVQLDRSLVRACSAAARSAASWRACHTLRAAAWPVARQSRPSPIDPGRPSLPGRSRRSGPRRAVAAVDVQFASVANVVQHDGCLIRLGHGAVGECDLPLHEERLQARSRQRTIALRGVRQATSRARMLSERKILRGPVICRGGSAPGRRGRPESAVHGSSLDVRRCGRGSGVRISSSR